MLSLFQKIPNDSKLIVAISGGPDSIYLLHRLLAIKSEKNFTLHLAHLNHNLRGRESDLDEKFVSSLAKHHKLPITNEKLPSSNTPLSEEKLRKYRYKFLEKVRRQTKSDFIVTGHNYDDQTETIIFNFIRGSGSRGLTGMYFQHQKILRPLLRTKKTSILNYLQKHEIKFRLDQSNQDLKYTRNFIRHAIMPLVTQLNPNIYQSLHQLSVTLRSQNNYIHQQTINFLLENNEETLFPIDKWSTTIKKTLHKSWPYKSNQPLIVFPLKNFKNLHRVIQLNTIRLLLHPLVPTEKQLTYKHITEIRKILLFSRGNSQKLLFNNLSIMKKNGKILLYKLHS